MSTPADAATGATTVFLAVHSPQVLASATEIAAQLSPQTIVVSLAPKITMAQLAEKLPAETPIVRLLPNAPSMLGEGYNPFAHGTNWAADIEDRWQRLTQAWGECPNVPERDLEGYAVITARGPTYFWFQWQTLEKMAREFGLPEARIRPALAQMLVGAQRLYFVAGLLPLEVVDLIPVKPLPEQDTMIAQLLEEKLMAIYQKIKP